MKIFVPRVPNTVTPNDLRVFSANILEKKFHMPFTGIPEVLSCDILEIKDAQLSLTEHHGLISIQPDSAGQWFIHNLRNQRLHHKLLFARPYYTRSDRRQMVSPENDRRRKHLEIGKFNIKDVHIEGLEQFAQMHIN